jgi:hypothetical protein
VENPMLRNSMIGFGVIRVSGWVRGKAWGVHACWTGMDDISSIDKAEIISMLRCSF